MAKKAVKPVGKYSLGDLCLIALLSEPIKRDKIKRSDKTKIKQSEELLRSIILNDLIFNDSTFSSSTI